MKVYKFVNDESISGTNLKYVIIENNILDFISFYKTEYGLELIKSIHDDPIKQSYCFYKRTNFMQFYEDSVYNEIYVDKFFHTDYEGFKFIGILQQLGYVYYIQTKTKDEHDLILSKIKDSQCDIHIDHRDNKFSNIVLSEPPSDSLEVLLELLGIEHEPL